jgi:hypothetical protein
MLTFNENKTVQFKNFPITEFRYMQNIPSWSYWQIHESPQLNEQM